MTYQCNGAGFVAGSNAAPQTVSVVVNHPATVASGASYSVTATVPTLNLVAAPPFLDLNAAGITANAAATVSNGTIGNAGPATVFFVGNGATGTVAPLTAIGTAGAAGTMTGDIGTINILSGSTGFICTPTAPVSGAAFSITVA